MSDPPDQSKAQLRRLVLGYRVSQALGVVARLAIADLLRDGPREVEELARLAGAKADPLARVLRLLTGQGVFEEVAPGRFGLTPMAEHLMSGSDVRARVALDTTGASWAAWGRLFDAVRTGEPAFAHAHGVDLATHLQERPDTAKAFDAMVAEDHFCATHAAAEVYPLPENAVVVDVGGERPDLVLNFIQTHDSIRAVLYGPPETVEANERRVAKIGYILKRDTDGTMMFPGLPFFHATGRLEIVGGDLGSGAIPEGGTHYFLNGVLRARSDEACVTILKRCRAVMGPAARLVVVGLVLPPPNTASDALMMDVHGLVMDGGRERSAEDYASLFDASDLELTRILGTECGFSLVEAKPRGG